MKLWKCKEWKQKLDLLFGTYELIFTHGPYLAGVHESPDIPTAVRLGEALHHKIAEAGK